MTKIKKTDNKKTKKVTAKKTVPKKATTKKTIVKKAAPKKAAKKVASKKTVPKKTAVKNSVAKKATTKKVVKKTTNKSASNLHASCSPDKYFFLSNQKQLKSIKDLADELEKISVGEFHHHVNNHKNDFVNWINDVFKQKTLANKVRKTKDIKDTRLIIYRYLLENK